MNTKNLIALFVALVVCFAAVANASAEFEQFNDFIKKHNKKYSMEEFHARFAIFKDNLVRINKYNQMSKTAKFGVNQFADLTADEFRSIYLSKTPAVRDPSLPVAEEIDLKANPLPASFDWREKGAVTPVKNQGQCGSCWSFSTTGNIEGQWFLAGHNLTSLSEQNLVDCDHHCMEYDGKQSCDNGCNGGLQPNAFQYVIDNGGIDTEASYPYTGVDGQCKFKASNIGAKIDNFTMVSTDEDQIAAYLVQHGPLSIAADAAEWQFYMGGIFDIPCGKELDHGILMVGFGTQKNWLGHETPYWIIKNSWGPSWGEDGYILIERGSGKCGLNTFVSSAIIY